MGHATVHYRDAPVTLCKNTAPDHECMPGRSACLQAMVRRHLETTRAIAATVAPAGPLQAPAANTAPTGQLQPQLQPIGPALPHKNHPGLGT